jgi:[acyl-carrier-protein] S-malonyltransferase
MAKCIVFPGQGSQYLGMGKFLMENFTVSKRVFEEVDTSLNQNLSKIIFGEDVNKLNLTENTQPAIMAVSIATFEALKIEKGIKIDDFDFCAGHSLGEYSALVASESLKISEAAKILKKRGQAMQSSVPLGEGGMAAVLNIDIESLEKLILEKKLQTVEISNDNCPGQCVISGAKQEIDKMIVFLKEELKKKTIPLPVSAPFHCAMMKPAAKILEDYITDFNFHNPKIPLVSNVSAKGETSKDEIKKLLIKCVYSRVKWKEIVEFFSKNQVVRATECGPGKALTNMFKRFEFDIKCLKLDSLEDIKSYE